MTREQRLRLMEICRTIEWALHKMVNGPDADKMIYINATESCARLAAEAIQILGEVSDD